MCILGEVVLDQDHAREAVHVLQFIEVQYAGAQLLQRASCKHTFKFW